MRPSKRQPDELRPIRLVRHYTKHAEGSVLVEYGHTQVLCTASLVSGVPRFLKGKNKGWLTAEYGMLPRATNERTQREAVRGKQSGRTMEIQRLIGRALRATVDLSAIGDYTIHIDCDVIQADGGTRTASITGSCVALIDALNVLKKTAKLPRNPVKQLVAGVSVGVYQDTVVLDLDYDEDSTAETDMNFVMTEHDEFIELQGTAEGAPFNAAVLEQMIAIGRRGIADLISVQRKALAES